MNKLLSSTFTVFALLLVTVAGATAQLNPAITHWIINRTGATGFGGIPTNVQQVQYSTNNVYVSTTDIADWIPLNYDWPNNPWFPENMNFVFKITLNPAKNEATPVETPLGHIGVWTNGVSIYNAKDARTYRNQNVWAQNAFYFEHLDMETMDSCLGHPNDHHEYHLHVHPKCLWDEYDSTTHAPILGYAFDGFPVYGAYGYANTDGTGGIRRIRTSFRLRSISDRTTLPNGTQLSVNQYGPSLAEYPLGAYVQDYEYVQGLGDLDEHNGRFTVTPEYPNGIYAYFVSLDHAQDGTMEPVYPYVLGPTFYGTIQPGNLGPGSGRNTITEPTTVVASVRGADAPLLFAAYPNPVATDLHFIPVPAMTSNMTATLCDVLGNVVRELHNVQPAVRSTINVSGLPNGLYFLKVESRTAASQRSVLVVH